jgi:hypothetical protein
MSRSRRRTPVRGITSASTEKPEKQAAHRLLRRVVRVALTTGDAVLPHAREHSDPWCMAKDGKVRFDPDAEPKAMRK